MKKETIITSLITIILNLIWSIVFDLLPNIVDFSIIGEIQISKYLIFIPVLVLINIGIILLFRFVIRRSWEVEAFVSQLKPAINKLIEKEAENITGRPPAFRPGPHQVLLKYYNDVINQLTNRNGKIEFKLTDYPQIPDFDMAQPLFLSSITPGMFKYFMVFTQDILSNDPSYVRISPDHEGTPQEFTFTWFDNIFPILGNMSDKISSLEAPLPNLPESSGYYEVRKYKFIKRIGGNFIKIYVV